MTLRDAVGYRTRPLASRLGYPGALAVSLTVLGGVAWATVVLGRRRNPPPVDRPAAAPGLWRIVRGSWPLWVGALVLAGLNASAGSACAP